MLCIMYLTAKASNVHALQIDDYTRSCVGIEKHIISPIVISVSFSSNLRNYSFILLIKSIIVAT